MPGKQEQPSDETDIKQSWSTNDTKDILQMAAGRRSSMESTSPSVGRFNVDFTQLPEEAMRELSQEEREHIQRIMNTASRAHVVTSPQQLRR